MCRLREKIFKPKNFLQLTCYGLKSKSAPYLAIPGNGRICVAEVARCGFYRFNSAPMMRSSFLPSRQVKNAPTLRTGKAFLVEEHFIKVPRATKVCTE
jgi:hypothetical protein